MGRALATRREGVTLEEGKVTDDGGGAFLTLGTVTGDPVAGLGEYPPTPLLRDLGGEQRRGGDLQEQVTTLH